MGGIQMVIVDSVVEELLENYVQMQTPGQHTIAMTLIIVVEGAECPGVYTCPKVTTVYCKYVTCASDIAGLVIYCIKSLHIVQKANTQYTYSYRYYTSASVI